MGKHTVGETRCNVNGQEQFLELLKVNPRVLNSQCSPLSNPFEVNEYLMPLEIRPMLTTDRHLWDSSKRKKKSTGGKRVYCYSKFIQ